MQMKPRRAETAIHITTCTTETLPRLSVERAQYSETSAPVVAVGSGRTDAIRGCQAARAAQRRASLVLATIFSQSERFLEGTVSGFIFFFFGGCHFLYETLTSRQLFILP